MKKYRERETPRGRVESNGRRGRDAVINADKKLVLFLIKPTLIDLMNVTESRLTMNAWDSGLFLMLLP